MESMLYHTLPISEVICLAWLKLVSDEECNLLMWNNVIIVFIHLLNKTWKLLIKKAWYVFMKITARFIFVHQNLCMLLNCLHLPSQKIWHPDFAWICLLLIRWNCGAKVENGIFLKFGFSSPLGSRTRLHLGLPGIIWLHGG